MSGAPPDSQLQEALALNASLHEMELLMSRVEAGSRQSRVASGAAGGKQSGGVGGYGGRTFTSSQENEIQRNNAHLVNKLARVRGVTSGSTFHAAPPPVREGTASINRRKKANEIERENARLVSRIQGQKSSLSGMTPPPSKPKPTSIVGLERGGYY
ncbi:hypothetical protein T492DRAFT_1076149 [Pavlovales sp. CCMP2436]|nr:hypothetical protein T492DRAFT_1076149 [Pavlovales sp. CCMP2436]